MRSAARAWAWSPVASAPVRIAPMSCTGFGSILPGQDGPERSRRGRAQGSASALRQNGPGASGCRARARSRGGHPEKLHLRSGRRVQPRACLPGEWSNGPCRTLAPFQVGKSATSTVPTRPPHGRRQMQHGTAACCAAAGSRLALHRITPLERAFADWSPMSLRLVRVQAIFEGGQH